MTALVTRVTTDIATAMRQKESITLSTLRMLKAALMNKEVERSRDLDEAESVQVVTALVKQRRDAIEQFKAGGRQDLVDRETAEIGVLERYLPPAASDADIQAAIEAAVAETGATSAKDMGRVMKAVMAQLAGAFVDGRKVSDAVKKRLSG
jgi:uncharacterized protein YqeY